MPVLLASKSKGGLHGGVRQGQEDIIFCQFSIALPVRRIFAQYGKLFDGWFTHILFGLSMRWNARCHENEPLIQPHLFVLQHIFKPPRRCYINKPYCKQLRNVQPYRPAFPRALTATLSPCSPAAHLDELYVKDSWAMALDLAGSLRAARTVLDARVTNCWVKIEEKGRGEREKSM